MEKEFVPYELAVKLKALGFDEPCLAYWFNETPTNPQGQCIVYYKKPWDNEKIVKGVIREYCSAPTFSQAFRWFREKYRLHNGIYPYYDEYEFQIKDFRLPTNTPINGGLMSYEEAELACLKKLIEIAAATKEEKSHQKEIELSLVLAVDEDESAESVADTLLEFIEGNGWTATGIVNAVEQAPKADVKEVTVQPDDSSLFEPTAGSQEKRSSFGSYLAKLGETSVEFVYSDFELYSNLEYFRECYTKGVSPYWALFSLRDRLDG